MLRQPVRQAVATTRQARVPRNALSRRFLSTAPPHERSRSWKNSLARWGVAGGLLYFYNTSSAFADEPRRLVHAPPETRHDTEEPERYPSIDEIAAERQARKDAIKASQSASPDAALAGSPDDLEAEAGQQGAFNEETGEINWDCPCLGGMAHGPCGEEFRAAFSCFVYSKEEPKGVDCIDRFKGMQECFRAHPDVYGAELDDEDDPELVGEDGPGAVPEGAEVGVGAASARGPSSPSASPRGAEKVAPETSIASVKENSE